MKKNLSKKCIGKNDYKDWCILKERRNYGKETLQEILEGIYIAWTISRPKNNKT